MINKITLSVGLTKRNRVITLSFLSVRETPTDNKNYFTYKNTVHL